MDREVVGESGGLQETPEHHPYRVSGNRSLVDRAEHPRRHLTPPRSSFSFLRCTSNFLRQSRSSKLMSTVRAFPFFGVPTSPVLSSMLRRTSTSRTLGSSFRSFHWSPTHSPIRT